MNNIIEVRNLTFKYQKTDENHQLNDISFHVKHGEWLSIISRFMMSIARMKTTICKGRSARLPKCCGLIRPILRDRSRPEYDLSLGVILNSKAQMFYGYRRLPFT